VKVDKTMPLIATPWHPHTKPMGVSDPEIIHPDDIPIEFEKECDNSTMVQDKRKELNI